MPSSAMPRAISTSAICRTAASRLPRHGVAQGLAVYQNGVRINSLRRHRQLGLPADNAIEGITIIGANPVYGLNALGGAVTS